MKKINILLFGATGMLGSMVLDLFSQNNNFNLNATVRSTSQRNMLTNLYPRVNFMIFDAKNPNFTSAHSISPDWIINATGVIKPFIHDSNSPEVENAIIVNSLFPHLLAKKFANPQTRIIQIATDCVFSGQRGKYSESDQYDPLDVYGKTKSLGEVNQSNFYNLRCSIIGPETQAKNSLLEWLLNQPQKAILSGFTNHHWNGLTTLHFAKICEGIIENNLNPTHTQHLIPSDKITKYQLLQLIASNFQRSDITVKPTTSKETIDRTLNTKYVKMNKLLWAKAGYAQIPTIAQMITQLSNYKLKSRT